jgi:CRISPR-associated protein Cmr3
LRPKIAKRPAIVKDAYLDAIVCLYAEILPGTNVTELGVYLVEPVPFGGEGKYVHVETVQPCEWPSTIPNRPRSLWYLATPAFIGADPAQPPVREGVKLRAAACGAGIAVSGWDVARNGPRPTRFAVPAGAVYFVEGQVPGDGPFALDVEEATEGWGFLLRGIW